MLESCYHIFIQEVQIKIDEIYIYRYIITLSCSSISKLLNLSMKIWDDGDFTDD